MSIIDSMGDGSLIILGDFNAVMNNTQDRSNTLCSQLRFATKFPNLSYQKSDN